MRKGDSNQKNKSMTASSSEKIITKKVNYVEELINSNVKYNKFKSIDNSDLKSITDKNSSNYKSMISKSELKSDFKIKSDDKSSENQSSIKSVNQIKKQLKTKSEFL